MTKAELAIERILGRAMTLADAARMHGIHPATLHYARKRGYVQCTKIGVGAHSIWLVDEASLAKWLEKHDVGTAAWAKEAQRND